jgi:hypothetical protein
MPIEINYGKCGVNLGLQVNYQLPQKPQTVYNPIYWQTRSLTNGDNQTKVDKYDDGRSKYRRDLSAGEVYDTIKRSLKLAGYHADCLPKSICELAQVAIHRDANEDLPADILHFILT